MDKLILASASPRRVELLNQIGITPDKIIPAQIDETPLKREKPRQYTLRMALEKNLAIASQSPDAFTIAADTTVAVGLRILGKPQDLQQAHDFLKMISGRRHRVITAIAISPPCKKGQKPEPSTRIVSAAVKFARLDDKAITDYLETNEWQGKAGAYAIQGHAARHIKWIEGSYSSIVGLPCFEVAQLLKGLGYRP